MAAEREGMGRTPGETEGPPFLRDRHPTFFFHREPLFCDRYLPKLKPAPQFLQGTTKISFALRVENYGRKFEFSTRIFYFVSRRSIDITLCELDECAELSYN